MRKTWHVSDSGVKLHDVNLFDLLEVVLTLIPEHLVSKIRELLPHKLKCSQNLYKKISE